MYNIGTATHTYTFGTGSDGDHWSDGTSTASAERSASFSFEGLTLPPSLVASGYQPTGVTGFFDVESFANTTFQVWGVPGSIHINSVSEDIDPNTGDPDPNRVYPWEPYYPDPTTSDYTDESNWYFHEEGYLGITRGSFWVDYISDHDGNFSFPSNQNVRVGYDTLSDIPAFTVTPGFFMLGGRLNGEVIASDGTF